MTWFTDLLSFLPPSWQESLAGFIPASVLAVTGLPLLVLVVVVVLTIIFLLVYAIQGTRIGFQLGKAIRALKKLRKEHRKGVDPARVRAILSSSPLKHLWEEYEDTLHNLRKASSGDVNLFEVRATVPAEAFFTKDVLVDARLFDDFTRHLPGILTGLGIIGTFAGLLDGLADFNPSSSEAAITGLGGLLEAVRHAFIASASAIGCAMLVMFLSRFVLALFYAKVEQLNQAIDTLYETGAGEEYLSRLVESSEKSEVHAAQLKDALVEDLNKMMTNLVDQQIQAQERVTQVLGERIGQSITDSLKVPMEKLGAVVEHASGNQGAAVHGMLESLLTAFMAKIEDTFGNQLQSVNAGMERSMLAMETVQNSLRTLVDDISRTNSTASEQMSGKLQEAMEHAATNQQAMSDQMRELVQEFRRQLTDEQARSNQALDETVGGVMKQLGGALEKIANDRHAAGLEDDRRNEQLTSRTSELVGGLGDQVHSLVEKIAEQVSKTQTNIDSLETVSLRAIDGMNRGAATMGDAAQRFESAGNSVSSVFERSKGLTDQMASAAGTLQTVAQSVRDGYAQYDNARKAVEAHVTMLTSLIENAKQEAGVTKQLVSDMERIVTQLHQAEKQSEEYLGRVNETLQEAFESFGSAMTNRVSETIRLTDTHLGSGVSHLTGVVQELGSALARMKRA